MSSSVDLALLLDWIIQETTRGLNQNKCRRPAAGLLCSRSRRAAEAAAAPLAHASQVACSTQWLCMSRSSWRRLPPFVAVSLIHMVVSTGGQERLAAAPPLVVPDLPANENELLPCQRRGLLACAFADGSVDNLGQFTEIEFGPRPCLVWGEKNFTKTFCTLTTNLKY